MPRDIPAEAEFFRRVRQNQMVNDPDSNEYRPSSAAFNHEQMSVDVKDFMDEVGEEPSFCLRDSPGQSLARISNAACVPHGQAAEHDPCPSDQPDNPYHANVVGKKTKSVARALAKASAWVIFRKPPEL